MYTSSDDEMLESCATLLMKTRGDGHQGMARMSTGAGSEGAGSAMAERGHSSSSTSREGEVRGRSVSKHLPLALRACPACASLGGMPSMPSSLNPCGREMYGT